MAGISLGTGLSSGIDYTTMISQLMQIEARPQTLLRIQLASARTDAGAYRDVNSSFAALVSAAKAVQDPNTWAAAKATSSATAVSATSTPGAAAGSVTFTVDTLAAAHSVVSDQTWASTTAVPASSPGTLTFSRGGGTATTIPTGTGSLADTIQGINDSGLGLVAQAVKTGPDEYRLQVTSATTGLASDFDLTFGTVDDFDTVTSAADAKLRVGTASYGYDITSTTNTFEDVLQGTTLTVSAKSTDPVTVTVASDTAGMTNAVQSLVNAANAVLTKIGATTDSRTGSIAALKGDFALTSLASQVLTAVSSAVGGDGSAVGQGVSASVAGLQLTREGKLEFKPAVFSEKLAADPTLVQGLFGGKLDVGTDNVAGTVDDVLATDGIGARLQRLAQQASDSVNGSLTVLANGQDTRAKDLTEQISDWDLRLSNRQASLTKQFNAMESALGALQNQASWLSSQLNSLPSWSSNS